MNIYFKLIDKTSLYEVLELFKIAATSIQKKNLTQWSQWLNPTEKDIEWLLDGFVKNEFYYVYNDENQHIGMFRYLNTDEVYWETQNPQARYVHSLVVKKEFGGQNLGELILRKIEAKILEDHCSIFRLDCNAANPYLIQFYENLGFKQVGTFHKNETSSFNLYEKNLLIK